MKETVLITCGDLTWSYLIYNSNENGVSKHEVVIGNCEVIGLSNVFIYIYIYIYIYYVLYI